MIKEGIWEIELIDGTIIQCTNNHIFGGYTGNAAFNSSNSFTSSKNAWLFTMTNPHNIPPKES